MSKELVTAGDACTAADGEQRVAPEPNPRAMALLRYLRGDGFRPWPIENDGRPALSLTHPDAAGHAANLAAIVERDRIETHTLGLLSTTELEAVRLLWEPVMQIFATLELLVDDFVAEHGRRCHMRLLDAFLDGGRALRAGKEIQSTLTVGNLAKESVAILRRYEEQRAPHAVRGASRPVRVWLGGLAWLDDELGWVPADSLWYGHTQVGTWHAFPPVPERPFSFCGKVRLEPLPPGSKPAPPLPGARCCGLCRRLLEKRCNMPVSLDHLVPEFWNGGNADLS